MWSIDHEKIEYYEFYMRSIEHEVSKNIIVLHDMHSRLLLRAVKCK